MSDSDDNAYSDYLGSRRAVLQRKRQPVEYCESDSDDDFVPLKTTELKKRKDILLEDDEDDDDDDDSLLKNGGTHDEQLQMEMHHMEEEYRRTMFSKSEYHIPVRSQPVCSSVLAKTMQMCEKLDGSTLQDDKTGANGEEDEEDVTIESFPVTVEVLDCESKNGKQRFELALDATFSEVRKKFTELWNCSSDEVVLTHKGTLIDRHTTPHQLGLRSLQIPHPVIEACRHEAVQHEVFTLDSSPDHFTLKAQLKNRRKPILVEVTMETTLLEIKQRVHQVLIEENAENVADFESMKVMFDYEYLTDDGATCEDIGFEHEDCIDVYI